VSVATAHLLKRRCAATAPNHQTWRSAWSTLPFKGATPKGVPVPNMTVTLSGADSLTETSQDAALPTIGTATTTSDGTWTYTLPSSLPSNLQATADANSGVLSVRFARRVANICPVALQLAGTHSVSSVVSDSQCVVL
jgi:hypothetical protein